MSNTFDGILREFPYISLDKFNCGTPICLLTHFHADHLAGLLNKLFSGIIYCSEITRELLKASPRYKKVLRFVQSVPLNTKTRLELPSLTEDDVYITLLEAYHCMGACMFLLEEEKGSSYLNKSDLKLEGTENLEASDKCEDTAILITGDLRAEKWWCNSLKNYPCLYPYLCGERRLSNLYIDTTFYYRQEPYIEIPPNNQGIYAAISMLKDYPLDDPEILFEFQDTTMGFEQVWAFVVSFFRGALIVSDEALENRLKLVTKFDKIHGSILASSMKPLVRKTDGKRQSPVFHAGNTHQPYSIRIKEFINFNIMDFAGICCPIKLNTISSDEPMELLYTTTKGTKFYYFRDRCWVLPLNGTELLPQDIKFVFSRHLSYSETVDLISMFKPKQVFPCCHSKEAWKSGFSMQRLYGDLCLDRKFLFDEMMRKDFGEIPKGIMNRPVATVNRWNIEQCELEREFVDKIRNPVSVKSEDKLQLTVPALIDLRKVARVPIFQRKKNAEQDPVIFNRKGEFILQNLVEQRQEEHYKDFIEYQQSLYYHKFNLRQYVPAQSGLKRAKISKVALGGSSDYSSNSSDSSIDLLDIKRMHKVRDNSHSSASQPRGSLESESNASHSLTRRLKRSFIASSFGSFEESMFLSFTQ